MRILMRYTHDGLSVLFQCCVALIKGCCGVFILTAVISAGNAAEDASPKRSADYIISDMTAIDLRNGTEWMRCSVGQQFDNGECTGEVVRLNQQEAAQAARLASRQLGGLWRLPTRDELQNLVCDECEDVKIDSIVFPDTEAEPYWTGEKNWISPKNYWSVNFMTGHSYGRFFGYQQLAVRLVKAR